MNNVETLTALQADEEVVLKWPHPETVPDDDVGGDVPCRDIIRYEIREGKPGIWAYARVIQRTSCNKLRIRDWGVGANTFMVRALDKDGQYASQPKSVNLATTHPAKHTNKTVRDEKALSWPGTKTNTGVDGSGFLVLSGSNLSGTYESPWIDLGSSECWRLGFLPHVDFYDTARTIDNVGTKINELDYLPADPRAEQTAREFCPDGASVWALENDAVDNIYSPSASWKLEVKISDTPSGGTYASAVGGRYNGRYVRFRITLTRSATTQSVRVEQMDLSSSKVGTGSGDVIGPSSSVADRIATFSGTTGKLIKDGGVLISDLATVSALSTHEAATTGVHGVGASTVASIANIATHAALTATHGVSGAIVGTTDTQILSNKSFSSLTSFSAGLRADTISENTADTGVTIDGVVLKDNMILAPDNFRWNSTNESMAVGIDAAGEGLEHVTSFGHGAAYNSTGTHVTAFGRNAGYENGGSAVSVFGRNAGQGNQASTLSAFGRSAAADNTGVDLTAMGVNAGTSQSGIECSVYGVSSGFEQTGDHATLMGYKAGWRQVGTDLAAFGKNAAYQQGVDNAIDVANVSAYGVGCAFRNQGEDIAAFGKNAAYQNVGADLSAFGRSAGYQNSGDMNTALGRLAFGNFVKNVGGAKTFSHADIDPVTDRITIAAHGFGAPGKFIHLHYAVGSSPVPGLDDDTVYQCKVIDTNTIWSSENITGAGTGTGHIYTPRTVYENSTAVGFHTEPDASNQCMIGDANVTEVKTAGVFNTTISTGTAPLTVTSTTMCANLNADLLDGNHASAFLLKAGGTMSGDINFNSKYATNAKLSSCELANDFDCKNYDLKNVTEITMVNGGSIGQAAGPLVTFDDTNNYLEITGCKVGILTTTPVCELEVNGKIKSTNLEVTGEANMYAGTTRIQVYDGEHTGSSRGEIWVEDDGGGNSKVCWVANDDNIYEAAGTAR